jgi:hypothetical protein
VSDLGDVVVRTSSRSDGHVPATRKRCAHRNSFSGSGGGDPSSAIQTVRPDHHSPNDPTMTSRGAALATSAPSWKVRTRNDVPSD